MSIFQRIVFLLKVLVMLSVGMSTAAWAQCPDHDEQASSGQVTHSGALMIAASESEPGDQGQGGSAGDDDSTTDDPDADTDEDEGA